MKTKKKLKKRKRKQEEEQKANNTNNERQYCSHPSFVNQGERHRARMKGRGRG
jgi:hypothetical protein